MVRVRMKVEGGAKLARRLAVLPKDVSGPALRDSAQAGAEIIRQAIADKVPTGKGDKVHKGNKIGHLKDSIVAEVTKQKVAQRVQISIGPDKKHYYGLFVEKGHKLIKVVGRKKKGGRIYRIKKNLGNVKAYPFIRPGFDESTDTAQQKVAAELKRRLKL